MGVSPAGIGRMSISSHEAEMATVLSALNSAYSRSAGYATEERIANALRLRGEGHLVPVLRMALTQLEVGGRVRYVAPRRWRPI